MQTYKWSEIPEGEKITWVKLIKPYDDDTWKHKFPSDLKVGDITWYIKESSPNIHFENNRYGGNFKSSYFEVIDAPIFNKNGLIFEKGKLYEFDYEGFHSQGYFTGVENGINYYIFEILKRNSKGWPKNNSLSLYDPVASNHYWSIRLDAVIKEVHIPTSEYTTIIPEKGKLYKFAYGDCGTGYYTGIDNIFELTNEKSGWGASVESRLNNYKSISSNTYYYIDNNLLIEEIPIPIETKSHSLVKGQLYHFTHDGLKADAYYTGIDRDFETCYFEIKKIYDSSYTPGWEKNSFIHKGKLDNYTPIANNLYWYVPYYWVNLVCEPVKDELKKGDNPKNSKGIEFIIGNIYKSFDQDCCYYYCGLNWYKTHMFEKIGLKESGGGTKPESWVSLSSDCYIGYDGFEENLTYVDGKRIHTLEGLSIKPAEEFVYYDRDKFDIGIILDAVDDFMVGKQAFKPLKRIELEESPIETKKPKLETKIEFKQIQKIEL